MIRTVVAVLLAAGLLTACGQSAPSSTPVFTTPGSSTPGFTEPVAAPKQHVLELNVTGTATLTLTFTLDGKTTEEKAVKPPWSKRIEIPYGTGKHEYKLTMQHSGGTLSATAVVNGRLVTRSGGSSSGGGSSTANLTGSFED